MQEELELVHAKGTAVVHCFVKTVEGLPSKGSRPLETSFAYLTNPVCTLGSVFSWVGSEESWQVQTFSHLPTICLTAC